MVICCDNRLLSKGHNFDCPINEHDVAILNLIRRLNARLTEVTILPPVGPDDFTQQQLLTEIPKRNHARAASVKTALLAFRDTYWRKSDRQSGFLPATLLPDDVLATLASEAKIKTMDDLNLALPGWTFALELGPGALSHIAELDADWLKKNKSGIQLRAAGRKAETICMKPITEEKERECRAGERKVKHFAKGGKPHKQPGEVQTTTLSPAYPANPMGASTLVLQSSTIHTPATPVYLPPDAPATPVYLPPAAQPASPFPFVSTYSGPTSSVLHTPKAMSQHVTPGYLPLMPHTPVSQPWPPMYYTQMPSPPAPVTSLLHISMTSPPSPAHVYLLPSVYSTIAPAPLWQPYYTPTTTTSTPVASSLQTPFLYPTPPQSSSKFRWKADPCSSTS
ncbi:hypothetical protein BC835DRAFT_1309588 [Cytidiella melzeri]|nr:hypothetical protein BC835DRAFT_1309588 [Cytidiella melzeri]